MDDELRKQRIELQERFDVLKEVTGINQNANKYEKRQCKTYLAFFGGLDILLEKQREVKDQERKCRLTAANIAEASGIAKTTIDHNDEFRAIITALNPKEGQEPVIFLSEHNRIVNEYKEMVKEKDRRLEEQRKTNARLALERSEHNKTKEELTHLQEHTEDLYRKLGHFLDEHPEAVKEFTTELPDIVMLLSFKSKGMS